MARNNAAGLNRATILGCGNKNTTTVKQTVTIDTSHSHCDQNSSQTTVPVQLKPFVSNHVAITSGSL